MSKDVAMIGIDTRELPWVRTLLALLRHPDPKVAELTRQALAYVRDSSAPPLSGKTA